jgi:hypothetical protein
LFSFFWSLFSSVLPGLSVIAVGGVMDVVGDGVPFFFFSDSLSLSLLLFFFFIHSLISHRHTGQSALK